MRNSFFILLLLSVQAAIGQDQFQLGVNLDDNGAFVNIINHTNRYSNANGYDSLGWPTSNFDLVLMDGRPVAEWTNSIDDPEVYRIDYSGRYKGSFKGQANVGISGTSATIENKAYDTGNNITTFDIVVGGASSANHGLVFLSFTNTRRTAVSGLNTGITELIVNRPGYPLNTNKVFTDEFISLCQAADFACYRFYNLQNIWDGEPTFPAITTWNNRKTSKDASQRPMDALNGKRDAWCWEYIVALSNQLNKDIWINIHTSCDSNYVVNLAQYLKQNLKAGINIYVENSNEVWSPSQATHGPYNQAQANFYKITFDENYARRTVDLSNWFATVFGSNEINKRIRVILAGQQAYPGRSDNHLNYIQSKIGEPKKYIYANSTTVYFGSTNASSTDPIAINSGMIDDINSQISNSSNAGYRLNHINKAKSWNLTGGCTSYEGGPHLPSGGGTANLNNQILSHRTSKMQDVLELNYLEGWKKLDGGLAMYFTLSSAYNRYGCWGLTDDYTNPDRNYKMQAMRKILSSESNGINSSNIKKYQIYPNPASDFIQIERGLDHTQSVIYEIYNAMGELILIHKDFATNRIDISSIPPGCYYLKTGFMTSRFIKS